MIGRSCPSPERICRGRGDPPDGGPSDWACAGGWTGHEGWSVPSPGAPSPADRPYNPLDVCGRQFAPVSRSVRTALSPREPMDEPEFELSLNERVRQPSLPQPPAALKASRTCVRNQRRTISAVTGFCDGSAMGHLLDYAEPPHLTRQTSGQVEPSTLLNPALACIGGHSGGHSTGHN